MSETPTIDTIYNVSNGYDLDYRNDTIVKNGTFFVWHQSTIGSVSIGMATSIASASNAMINAFWRMETTTDVTINSIKKLSSPVGGLSFNAVFPSTSGYAYIRQNINGVYPFGGRTFTACIDLEVDQACQMDCYARMRINANNDEDERPLIVDSEFISVSAGRAQYAISFICPDVDSFRGSETPVNSMEFAFRLYGTGKTVAAVIRGIAIVPGREVPHPLSSDPQRDVLDANVMYRMAPFSLVGLDTTSGQKRISIDLGGLRYTSGTVTLYDIAGTSGKISTYNTSGTRTDGVTPSINTDNLLYGNFYIYLTSSTVSGMGGWYVYNAYP